MKTEFVLFKTLTQYGVDTYVKTASKGITLCSFEPSEAMVFTSRKQARDFVRLNELKGYTIKPKS